MAHLNVLYIEPKSPLELDFRAYWLQLSLLLLHSSYQRISESISLKPQFDLSTEPAGWVPRRVILNNG